MLGKRLFALALTLSLLFSLTPVGALASEDDFFYEEEAALASVDTQLTTDTTETDPWLFPEDGASDDASDNGFSTVGTVWDEEDDFSPETAPEDVPSDLSDEAQAGDVQQDGDALGDDDAQQNDDTFLLDGSCPSDETVAVRFSCPQASAPGSLSVWDSFGNLMSPCADSADSEIDGSFYLLRPGLYSCLYHDANGIYEDYETTFELCAGQEEAYIELDLQPVSYDDLLSFIYINPIYADVVTEEEIARNAEKATDGFGLRSEQSFAFRSEVIAPYESMEDAAAEVRRQLYCYEPTVTVYLYHDLVSDKDVNVANWRATGLEIYNLAVVHTGSPKQGDYLKFEYGGYVATGSIDSKRSVFQFIYTPNYYTSAALEDELDGIVADVLAQLDLEGKNQYHKICAIYDYLCSTVTYDNVNLNNDAYKLKYTAYAALKNHCAICQGFSVAFYRLCLESGVDARVVSSKAMEHAWNIVQLGNVYYELDVTADKQKTPENYSYFLRGSSYWLSNHKLKGVSTIGDEFDNAGFASLYPLPSEDFVFPVSSVDSVSLPLSGPLLLKFKLSLSDMLAADANACAAFFIDGAALCSVPLSSGQPDGSLTVFSLPRAFDELSDTVTLKLIWGDGVPAQLRGTNGSDCTAGYHITPSAGLSNSSSPLAVSLYNLSAAAQNYFRSAGLGLSQQVLDVSGTDLQPYAVRTAGLKPSGCSGASVSALFEDSVCLRIYFQLGSGRTVSDFSFKIDGVSVIPVECDGGCFVSVEGLRAAELDIEHSFSISDNADSFTVIASALSYADSAVRRGSGAVQDLGRALYLYRQAA